MNLNAVLDVTAPRAPAPLDRSVSDDGGDPAFADVMSQYGPDGGGKSTGDAGATTATTAEAPAPASAQPGAAPTTAEPDELDADAAPAPIQSTGETLPSNTQATGQA